ncbi:MAG: 16S rRNA (uracil(1498)-N(3))-methyltransferase [Planctomycetes bacterium]|nr:16S rRNA (uracil(1498)-N(3))-methyltransferase [Planctomycetota bacterium]
MKLERYFITDSLSVGKSACLTRDQAKHCRTVMRNKVCDSVVLFNGVGGEFISEITEISKNDIVLKVLEFVDVNRVPDAEILLFTAMPKHKRFDFLIEKATELGVSKIIPLLTSRSGNIRSAASESKTERRKTKIIEACKQCGRNILPELCAPRNLESMLEIDADLKIVLHPSTTNFRITEEKSKFKSIALAIGPEGGFTDAEVRSLKRNGWQCLTIGQSILRVETAVIAALSIVNHILDQQN